MVRTNRCQLSVGMICAGFIGAALVVLLLFLCPLAVNSGQAAVAQYVQYTQHISDTAGGGDCGNIGVWSNQAKSCTLSNDLTFAAVDGIEIDSNGIILNGGGHSMTGGGAGNGIFLSGRSGDTVENVTVTQFSNGVEIDSTLSSLFSNIKASANGNFGIALSMSDGNLLTGNSTDQNMAGVGLDSSGNNSLLDNSFTNSTGGDGVTMINANGNSFVANSSDTNSGNGFCIDPNNNNNRFLGNETSANANNGFWLNSSDSNTISGNTSSNNNMASMGGMSGPMAGMGEISLNVSSNNTIYRNNFISGTTPQASVSGGSGNMFSLPLPAGGNYWSSWTAPDSNGDGIVDSPYVFDGGQDDLPFTSQNGWLTKSKPVLDLAKPSSFWASFDDYQVRQLSVVWGVKNSGGNNAIDVELTGNQNSESVQLLTALPVLVGDIASGKSGSVTLRYQVPDGVAFWHATNSGQAFDGSGDGYVYP